MRSPLCDAVTRCHARRLSSAVAKAPVPALIAGASALVAPLALARVGRGVGRELAGIAPMDAVATALVVGPTLSAAAAGAVLTLSFPGRTALGAFVAAGPPRDVICVVARVFVPLLVLALVVVPSLAAMVVSLAAELPGGGVAGVALLIATLAAVAAGAIVAEAAVALARGRPFPGLAVAGIASAWAGAGAAFGTAALGPFSLVAESLYAPTLAWQALVAVSVVAIALGPAWIVLAASRPPAQARRARTNWAAVPRGRLAVPVGIGAIVFRRGEVQLAGLCAFGFGGAGLAVGLVAGAPPPAGFLLATTSALLGSLLCPLVVCGAIRPGAWLWRVGPSGPWARAGIAGGIGFTGAVVPVAVVGAVAAALAGASWSTALVVIAIATVGAAAALLAGALIPWDGAAFGDQMTSYAALVGVLIAISLVSGLVGPRLVAVGVPDALVVVLICGAVLATAVSVCVHRLESDV